MNLLMNVHNLGFLVAQQAHKVSPDVRSPERSLGVMNEKYFSKQCFPSSYKPSAVRRAADRKASQVKTAHIDAAAILGDRLLFCFFIRVYSSGADWNGTNRLVLILPYHRINGWAWLFLFQAWVKGL